MAGRRIVVLNVASGYGGAEESIIHLVRWLLQREYYIVFLYEHLLLKEKLAGYQDDEIKLFRIATGSLKKLRNLFRLKGVLEEIYRHLETTDFIITNTYRSLFLLTCITLVFPALRAKKYIHVRDFQQPLLKYLLTVVKPDLVIIPTEAVMERFCFLNVFNTIALEDISFDLSDFESSHYKDDLNFHYKIGVVGNIIRWKGLDKALEVICILREKYRLKLKLNIYGEIPDKKYFGELESIIRRNNLEGSVDFKGFLKNISEIYFNNDMFLITSTIRYGGPETLSRVVIESWAFGKVPIAFNYGGPKYLIKDGYNGFLSKEDPEEMAAKAASLYSNTDKYREMSRNARASFESLQKSISARLERLFV